jgi:hypothetical protein
VRVFGAGAGAGAGAGEGIAGTAWFDWEALDAWYEKDEQVFVQPRNPCVRVDALWSQRHVRVALDGHFPADSRSVVVSETGLVTRYDMPRTEVDITELRRTDTRPRAPARGSRPATNPCGPTA